MDKNSKDRLIEINQKISTNKNNVKDEKAVQDYVKKIRKLNERMNPNTVGVGRKNLKTVYDQSQEEDKFRKNFDDLNVTVDFAPLKVYSDYIFWGGTIDGIIQFAYKVTHDENTSGVEFNYLNDFSVDNPDNDEIVKRIEIYYNKFYQYWRDNIFQTQN